MQSAWLCWYAGSLAQFSMSFLSCFYFADYSSSFRTDSTCVRLERLLTPLFVKALKQFKRNLTLCNAKAFVWDARSSLMVSWRSLSCVNLFMATMNHSRNVWLWLLHVASLRRRLLSSAFWSGEEMNISRRKCGCELQVKPSAPAVLCFYVFSVGFFLFLFAVLLTGCQMFSFPRS